MTQEWAGISKWQKLKNLILKIAKIAQTEKSDIDGLPEGTITIMNKYLAGLFRTSALRSSNTKKRILRGTGAGVEEIVILCRKGMS